MTIPDPSNQIFLTNSLRYDEDFIHDESTDDGDDKDESDDTVYECPGKTTFYKIRKTLRN